MTSQQDAGAEELTAPVTPTEPAGTPGGAAPAGAAGAAVAAPDAPRRRGGTRYRILIVLLCLLSFLAIVMSTVVLWTHQVALNTDRWVEVVGPVAAEPEVQQAVSTKAANKIVVGLDVQGRLANVLPEQLQLLAVPITNQIEQGLQQRLATAMATPQFQTAWLAANRVAHEQIVDILRGDSESVYVEDGYVVLDVWPLVGIALEELQAQGIIPASVTLPDLSQGLPAGAFDRLNTALGGRIPADVGTIPLVPADKLEQAQQIVSVFDLITIALIALAVILVLVAIWYSVRRRRTIVILALGGAAAIVIARFVISGLESAIVSSVTDADTATTIRGVTDAALSSLYGFSQVVIVAGVVVALVAYLTGRPKWLDTVAGGAREATGRAAAGAGAAAQAGLAGAPTRETVSEVVRDNRRSVEFLGVGAIAFVVLWIASGFWIALLAVTLIGLLKYGIDQLEAPAGGAADDPGPTPVEPPMGTGGAEGAG